MKGAAYISSVFRMRAVWAALGLAPLLSGCAAAVAVPLLAGGTLSRVTHHPVHAATSASAPRGGKVAAPVAAGAGKSAAKPAPASPPVAADESWAKFFAYALSQQQSDGSGVAPQSAILKPDPSIDEPERRDCTAPIPAVVIDLDSVATPFAPERIALPPPSGVAEGLIRLRKAGIVVLWISQLPASRADDVAGALRKAGLDPWGQDQLLLIRDRKDRKQLLRDNASDDVCIVAIAGDTRGDFDELFDYLRNPASAVGLYPMIGSGWFFVTPLETGGTPPQ